MEEIVHIFGGENSWKTATWKRKRWEDNMKMVVRDRTGGEWNWFRIVSGDVLHS
jgi:hypothetical protein